MSYRAGNFLISFLDCKRYGGRSEAVKGIIKWHVQELGARGFGHVDVIPYCGIDGWMKDKMLTSIDPVIKDKKIMKIVNESSKDLRECGIPQSAG